MNFSDFKNSKNLLTNEQMKNVMGGNGGWGTCGYKSWDGAKIECGVSKTVALSMADGGGRWCCDSCAISTYCGNN